MAKKIKVQIPEYFSVKHYKSLGSFEHLDEVEKVIHTIVATTEHSEEEVMRWSMKDMLQVFRGIESILDEVGTEFYPVFEFKGITYGFQPISKMSVGEWMDLDRRLDNPIENLEEILLILYRTVVKNNFESLEWKIKDYIRHLKGEPTTLFNMYEVEEYDVEKREWRKEVFQHLPIEYALGALHFFIVFGLTLQRDLATYSPNMTEEQRKKMVEELDNVIAGLALGSTTDGSLYSETLIPPKSSKSQEIKE